MHQFKKMWKSYFVLTQLELVLHYLFIYYLFIYSKKTATLALKIISNYINDCQSQVFVE
jgi:hypothetical protein